MLRFDSFDEVPFEVVRGAPAIIGIGATRFAIVGTPYGWQHASNGDRAIFGSYRTAKRHFAREVDSAGGFVIGANVFQFKGVTL